MTSRLHIALFAVILAAAGVCRAEAQQPQRPFRGLFGGAQSMSTRGEMLDLSMSAFVGWDEPQPVVNPLESSADDRTLVSGPFSGGSAAASYTHPGDHFNFSGSGSAFTGYFPDNADHPWYDSYSASGNLSWRTDLTRRTHLGFGENLSYTTDINLGSVIGAPGGSIGTVNNTFETALVHEPLLSSASTLDLSHSFSQKSTGSVYYGFQTSQHFSDDETFPDFGTHSVGARFQHKLTKDLGYHLGYAYNRSMYFSANQDQPNFSYHTIDAGLDFAHALSLTRTTTVAFGAGTAISSGASSNSSQPPFSDQQFFFVGHVNLNQQIGRSWDLSAYYDRSLSYANGFSQPGIFDTAGVNLAGFISRRLDVSVGSHYQTGKVGLQTRNYHSWDATAQIRGAITRNLAAYAYYYYFQSDVSADVLLPPGVPHTLDRNGVRAGITAWLPLWYGRGAP